MGAESSARTQTQTAGKSPAGPLPAGAELCRGADAACRAWGGSEVRATDAQAAESPASEAAQPASPVSVSYSQTGPGRVTLLGVGTGFAGARSGSREGSCLHCGDGDEGARVSRGLSRKRRAETAWAELLPTVPVTSSGRFFRAVTTGPSFLRSRGLLRRSATFCFSRDRNFRLGSEAAQKGDVITAGQTHLGPSLSWRRLRAGTGVSAQTHELLRSSRPEASGQDTFRPHSQEEQRT